jgi:hypothetical protein
LLTSGYGTYLLDERSYVTTMVSLRTTAAHSARGILLGSSAASAARSERSAILSSAFFGLRGPRRARRFTANVGHHRY